jgi:hypothetical protein
LEEVRVRIKELEDVLKLVDRMPRDLQLRCVEMVMMVVDYWEERESLGMTDLEYLAETLRRKGKWPPK